MMTGALQWLTKAAPYIWLIVSIVGCLVTSDNLRSAYRLRTAGEQENLTGVVRMGRWLLIRAWLRVVLLFCFVIIGAFAVAWPTQPQPTFVSLFTLLVLLIVPIELTYVSYADARYGSKPSGKP